MFITPILKKSKSHVKKSNISKVMVRKTKNTAPIVVAKESQEEEETVYQKKIL